MSATEDDRLSVAAQYGERRALRAGADTYAKWWKTMVQERQKKTMETDAMRLDENCDEVREVILAAKVAADGQTTVNPHDFAVGYLAAEVVALRQTLREVRREIESLR